MNTGPEGPNIRSEWYIPTGRRDNVDEYKVSKRDTGGGSQCERRTPLAPVTFQPTSFHPGTVVLSAVCLE